MKYVQLDIDVTKQANGCWHVSFAGYTKAIKDSNEYALALPNETHEFIHKHKAVEWAEMQAEIWISNREADAVTVFVEGNEKLSLPAPLPYVDPDDIQQQFDDFRDNAVHSIHSQWTRSGFRPLFNDELDELNDALLAFFTGKEQ